MEELRKFMASFFAEKEVWVSKDIEIPKETGGFEFKHKDKVKGVVVFGDRYPLSNIDMPIEQHLSVWRAINNTDSFGALFNIDGSEIKTYVDKEGNISYIR